GRRGHKLKRLLRRHREFIASDDLRPDGELHRPGPWELDVARWEVLRKPRSTTRTGGIPQHPVLLRGQATIWSVPLELRTLLPTGLVDVQEEGHGFVDSELGNGRRQLLQCHVRCGSHF